MQRIHIYNGNYVRRLDKNAQYMTDSELNLCLGFLHVSGFFCVTAVIDWGLGMTLSSSLAKIAVGEVNNSFSYYKSESKDIKLSSYLNEIIYQHFISNDMKFLIHRNAVTEYLDDKSGFKFMLDNVSVGEWINLTDEEMESIWKEWRNNRHALSVIFDKIHAMRKCKPVTDEALF